MDVTVNPWSISIFRRNQNFRLASNLFYKIKCTIKFKTRRCLAMLKYSFNDRRKLSVKRCFIDWANDETLYMIINSGQNLTT